MAMDFYIHRFPDAVDMPIPPVAEHTEIIEIGAALSIGVEYRIITNELVETMGQKASAEIETLSDTGVSLHVYVKAADGNLERLRFDCFADAPHYHYLSWAERKNDHVFIDPALHHDVLAGVLDLIRTRLPHMLRKTGIENPEAMVDQRLLEATMPRVAEAAYRARFHADVKQIERGALADGALRRA